MDILATAGLTLFAILLIAFLVLHPKQTFIWGVIICAVVLLIKYLSWVALIICSLIVWGCVVFLIRKYFNKSRRKNL